MPKIVLSGRTDVDEFFKKSGVLESERLVHHPLLVFLEGRRKRDTRAYY